MGFVFVRHAFISPHGAPHGHVGRNECVTNKNKPHRTSAGRLRRSGILDCYAVDCLESEIFKWNLDFGIPIVSGIPDFPKIFPNSGIRSFFTWGEIPHKWPALSGFVFVRVRVLEKLASKAVNASPPHAPHISAAPLPNLSRLALTIPPATQAIRRFVFLLTVLPQLLVLCAFYI